MNDEKIITKQEFEEAYRKFPPSKLELFFLKHISLHSLYDNKIATIIIVLLTIAPLISEIIFNLIPCSNFCKVVPSAIYMAILVCIGVYWVLLYAKKKQRYTKIRKYLGISQEHYNRLVETHFYHRYPNIEKYIKYNSKCKK